MIQNAVNWWAKTLIGVNDNSDSVDHVWV